MWTVSIKPLASLFYSQQYRRTTAFRMHCSPFISISSGMEPNDHWIMNDEQFEEYIKYFPDEMFGGQPVKMNFSDLFKLTLARQKFVRKFLIHRQFYNIDISHLPYHLDSASSMAVLPELFRAIFDICTKTFTPNDRITIELQCKDFDPNIYPPPPEYLAISTSTGFYCKWKSSTLRRNSRLMTHFAPKSQHSACQE